MKKQGLPNILIFFMDTQPIRNMTPYGFPKDTTPNVQKIADEGVVYENHFVTGAWTVPSFASLFTGKYQSGHGAGGSFNFLSRDMPTRIARQPAQVFDLDQGVFGPASVVRQKWWVERSTLHQLT